MAATLYKFNPALMEPEELKATLIGRERTVGDIIERISAASAGRSIRHCIIVGPRGMGKTHILLVVYYAVKEEEKFTRRWQVVRFHEEEYAITTLGDFFIRLLRELEEGNPSAELTELLAKISRREDKEIIDLSLAFIRDFKAKTRKKILLLIDNLNQLLGQIGDDAAVGRLRDILMREDIFMIVGAASTLFKEIMDYDRPFYNFFEILPLQELDSEEIEALILKRVELEGKGEIRDKFNEYRPRIKAIVHLTGGNPRLVLMLYHIFSGSGLVEVQNALESLLDELTPYFQDRMNSLPPQQAKILDVLSLMEGPSTPTRLAKQARLPVNIVTSQLNRLMESGYVRSSKQKGRKKVRYEVTERLFRIWREMRTVKGRTRITFLIKFLRLWYTEQELAVEMKKLEERYLEVIKTGGVSEAKDIIDYVGYIQEVVSLKLKYRIYDSRIDKLLKLGKINEAEEEVRVAKREVVRSQDKKALTRVLWTEATVYACKKDWPKAIKALDELLGIDETFPRAFRYRGIFLDELGRHDEAIKSLDKAVKTDSKDSFAWRKLAVLYYLADKYEKAFGCITKTAELKPNDAEVWGLRSEILFALNRPEEALESITKAHKLNPGDSRVWATRGTILNVMGRHEEALESISRATELNPADAESWIKRSRILISLREFEKALQSSTRAIELNSENPEARIGQSLALYLLGRDEEAFGTITKAIELVSDDIRGWGLQSEILLSLGRLEDALRSITKAIQMEPDDARAWNTQARILVGLKKPKEALESIDKAIKLNPNEPSFRITQSRILFELNRSEEALNAATSAFSIVERTNDQMAVLIAAHQVVASSLTMARKDVLQGNYGLAEEKLTRGLTYGKHIEDDELQGHLTVFLKEILTGGKPDFAESALQIIFRALGADYRELLKPFSTALEYLKNRDPEILEKLHPEVREIVEEIVKKAQKQK